MSDQLRVCAVGALGCEEPTNAFFINALRHQSLNEILTEFDKVLLLCIVKEVLVSHLLKRSLFLQFFERHGINTLSFEEAHNLCWDLRQSLVSQ